MPKQKCTEVYAFTELDDDAKERARAWWYRNGALDDEWWDYTYDDFTTIATALGFTIGERSETHYNEWIKKDVTTTERRIRFSGFSSQWDGACFEGRWKAEDVKLADFKSHVGESDTELYRIANRLADFAREHQEFSATLLHTGHDNTAHSIDFQCEEPPVGTDDENCDDLVTAESEEEFIELARDLMQWLYRQLNKEHDYRLSDEAIDEELTANDHEFLKSGQHVTF